MQIINFLTSILVGFLLAFSASAATFTVASDRMAVLDGQRVFILGLYENPKEEQVLAQAAEAGFNLVYTGEDTAALDRLQRHGVWGWVNTGSRIDLSEDAENRAKQLEAMVGGVGRHPALIVWEVPDEALWNCWYGPLQWRGEEESKQLRALIDALEDKTLAEPLRKELAQSRALWEAGEYTESERMADAIWKKLGKDSPQPNYGLSTSPERAAKMGEGMLKGYAQLHELDPKHPIWMNHAPRNQISQLAAFSRAADIAGCDIYPVPFSPKQGHSDLAERSPATVGVYTDRMQQAAPGKPVWMVLQGFGWGDIQPGLSDADKKELRRPTFNESRFMAYDAIVHGARGILYWGTASVEKDSILWNDLLKLARELKGLQPVLAAPDADLEVKTQFQETFGSVDRGIHVLAKAVENRVWFLVVNEFPEPLTYSLRGLDALNGKKYTETASGKEGVVMQGTLTLTIRGQTAHILKPL